MNAIVNLFIALLKLSCTALLSTMIVCGLIGLCYKFGSLTFHYFAG